MLNLVGLSRERLSHEFQRLTEGSTLVEAELQRRSSKLRDWYDEQLLVVAEDEDADAQREFEDFIADEAAEVTELLPRVFRTSLFVTAYALTEHFLDTVARHYEQHRGGVRLSDLRHDGIIRAQVYLKKAVGMSFPDAGAEWQFLQMCRRLRNALVHADGTFRDADTEVLRFQQSTGLVRFDSHNRVVLESGFIDYFVNVAMTFADALCANAPPLRDA